MTGARRRIFRMNRRLLRPVVPDPCRNFSYSDNYFPSNRLQVPMTRPSLLAWMPLWHIESPSKQPTTGPTSLKEEVKRRFLPCASYRARGALPAGAHAPGPSASVQFEDDYRPHRAFSAPAHSGNGPPSTKRWNLHTPILYCLQR